MDNQLVKSTHKDGHLNIKIITKDADEGCLAKLVLHLLRKLQE